MSQNDLRYQVVSLAQGLLEEYPRAEITPSVISDEVDKVLLLKPHWAVDLDRAWALEELIRRFSVWVGNDSALMNHEGHVDWLTADRKREWRYWRRYQQWLQRKLPWPAVDALDRSNDHILGMLEDPHREGRWSRRGLVVGHVQSGKTGNYTGLICKAADAGYKIIIVLAGLHNNLRSQTQMRLDEGFLGFETSPQRDDSVRAIGVGEVDRDPDIRPNYVTNRTEGGDFSTAIVRNLGIKPESRPWLFVIKKNKTVLQRLLSWIRNHVADFDDDTRGTRIVTRLPLLVIDDEADNASVDTREQAFDAEGRPDEEHDPTAINSLIRKVLHHFSRSAYVGYTATPFANIFIHERGATTEEGPDLFPSAFIINLGAPSNYVGPARLFGTRDGRQRTRPLPLVRALPSEPDQRADHEAWMPNGHKATHAPRFEGEDVLPPSLQQAVDAFFLACAARRVRGQKDEHCSMLVHVTRFNDVQERVWRQVDRYVSHVKQRILRRIDNEAIEARLEELWQDDFEPTSRDVLSLLPEEGREPPTWAEIREALPDVFEELKVKEINGRAKDALDYVDHGATGLKVIAIGGDKLARGLTLEGLTVSYFLRASRMYDTLMQMGRWFGYRPGYLDLTRLYTTPDLIGWFEHITDASEELRQEFDLMASLGGTPRDFGLKVQSHPLLAVTSPMKMRTAHDLKFSYSGKCQETTLFPRDEADHARNYAVLTGFLSALPPGSPDVVRSRPSGEARWSGHLWEEVSAAAVNEFLRNQITHPKAFAVKGSLLSEFIELMNAHGELTHWTVALIGPSDETKHAVLPTGACVARTSRSYVRSDGDSFAIRRLISPRDESIDLDSDAWAAALKETKTAWRADPARMQAREEPDEPNGPSFRRVRGFGGPAVAPHPERGLMTIYLLESLSVRPPRERGEGEADRERSSLYSESFPIVAFSLSFPGSAVPGHVTYKANNVLWELEYGD